MSDSANPLLDCLDKELMSRDHRDFINLNIFGPLKRMMVRGEASNREIEYPVIGPDGSLMRAKGMVCYGIGQPQEPQFQLYTDLIGLWIDMINDIENFDVKKSENRTIEFKSINSLMELQQKSSSGQAFKNLIEDLKVLKHTTFTTDVVPLNDLLYREDPQFRMNVAGHGLIDSFQFDSQDDGSVDSKTGISGHLVLGQYFCEMALKGFMVTYNRGIYHHKKLGAGMGRRLYRVLNVLDADERKKEKHSRSKGEHCLINTEYKYELNKFIYTILGFDKDIDFRDKKRDLKKQINIFISFGLLKPKDGLDSNGDCYDADSCFETESRTKKTVIILRLGDFFMLSDRHEAEKNILQTDYSERDLMHKLKSLKVGGIQPSEFIALTKSKESVKFSKQKNGEEFVKEFYPGEFSFQRLLLIANWFELRDKLKKKHPSSLPNGMVMHNNSGALVDNIKFDSFPWRTELEWLESYFDKQEKLKNKLKNKPNINDFLSNSNIENDDKKSVVDMTDKKKSHLIFLITHKMDPNILKSYEDALNKVVGKEKARMTWFRSENFFSLNGQNYHYYSKLAEDWIAMRYMNRIREREIFSNLIFLSEDDFAQLVKSEYENSHVK